MSIMTGGVEMNENTFTQTHSKRTRQLALEGLTVLVLGFLLNLFASIIFDWAFNPIFVWSTFQHITIVGVIGLICLSIFFMIYLRMPENLLRKEIGCNLLWDVNQKRLSESVYDHPTGYNPQQFGFQMYEIIAKQKPNLLKGLGKDATKEDLKIIGEMFEYLVFFWLGWSALKPTYGLKFNPKIVNLKEIAKDANKNRIIALAKDMKTGWSPPNITIELPEDVSISIPKLGELIMTTRYCSICIRYRWFIRPLSSMLMGPVSSIMGMPINPFFLDKERKPERVLKLSGLCVAYCQMFFEAKFNKWMLLRRKSFYKYMEWAEQLSNLFVDFFDWGRNIEIASKSANERIYEMLKAIEMKIEEINGKKHK
jgi:hypothetical protein